MKKIDLTTPQKNIWNLQKFYENTSISNLCGAVFYDEKCDVKNLKKALNKEIEVHEGLRLRFCYDGETVKQYVLDYHNEDFAVLNFNNMSELDEYAQKRAVTPMNMLDSKMYSFEIFTLNKTVGVLLCANHLITDAWSFSLLAREVYELCVAFSENKVGEMPTHSYIDFVNSEQEYFNSNRFIKDEKYWNDIYTSKPQACYMKTDTKPAVIPTIKRFSTILEEKFTNGIDNFCKNHKISQAVLFESAVSIYMHKINFEVSDISIGVLVLNRSNPKEKATVGMFISTIPLKVTVSENTNAIDLCNEITSAHMKTFRHQKYPYAKIAENVHKKFDCTDSLYNAIVSFQNAKTDTNAYTKWYSNGYNEVPFSLHIDNRDSNGGYTVNIDYQTEIFKSDEEISFLHERLTYIIKQIIDEPEKNISQISIIPPDEYKKIIFDFNDTAVEYPHNKCVHELFSEQVEKNPDKIALIFEDKQFTYKQLDEMSNSLAHFLREEKGVKPNDIVSIISNRSWKYYVTVLGILKAGGAFLSIDFKYPIDRMLYIIKNSNSKVVIEINNELELEGNEFEIINFDLFDFYITDGISCVNTADDLCYSIFTSGSTGKPKGLMISHKNIVNFCHINKFNMCNKIISNKDTIFLSITNTSFDMFIAEFLLPLSNGIPILLANDMESENQNSLNILCEKYNPNIISSTPTKLRLLMNNKDDLKFINSINTFILGGEPLPEELCIDLHHITNANIYNCYGPAETTIYSTLKLIDDEITIGNPIANTQIYILDKKRNPLPIGVAGELCISGDGVGKGYLNLPELTAEKFIPNPFINGKIMYCTGDLARWRTDGEIEYLGRIDTQVKIRGLRIELGEIESVMSSFDGLNLTAVADKRDKNNRQYLAGYYTSDNDIDEKALRRYLSSKLPQYMIPNYFVRLDEMPMTASGKTDRKSLPVPNFTMSREQYTAPKSETEKVLCKLISSLLEVDNVGINDNFFELGGDSLKAIEYVTKAHVKGIEFTLQNVFDFPTVEQLCIMLNKDIAENEIYLKSDFEKYEKILCVNTVDDDFVPDKKSLGNVFLTGATGFLGAHILDSFMKNENGKIYCLVRGENSSERLLQILRYYFGEKYTNEIGERIIVLSGELENAANINIPQDVQTVIHSAATVKHYGSHKYFYNVNVEGTKNILNIAKKINAQMIYISTISVSGNSFVDVFEICRVEEEKFFRETSLYIEQPLDNVYVRSKFEAEKVVLDAALNDLNVKIIRVGNLTNRASDLKFQPNYTENAFLKRIKAALELGMIPDYLMHLYAEFSPIDYTAEGVIKIIQYAGRYNVFHLNSNKSLYFDKMVDILNSLGIKIDICNAKDFNTALEKTVNSRETEYIYQAFQNDMDGEGRLAYDSNIRIVNDFTVYFLRKVGFEWPQIDFEYIKRYIEYFRSLGYFEV